MDEIILDSNMLPDKKNQPCSIEDLKRLSKLLKMDVANFGGKNFEGFPIEIANKITNIVNKNYDKDTSTICILNDVTLEQTYSLLNKGYNLKNIYLAFGKWDKKEKGVIVSPDITPFDIVEEHLENNFKNKFNILKLSDVYNMGDNNMSSKFDIIIANPPYGDHCALGNKIVKEILSISKEQLILMPLKGWKTNNIYKNIQSVEMVEGNHFDVLIPDLAIVKSSNTQNPLIHNWIEDVILKNVVDKNLINFYLFNYYNYQTNSLFSITFASKSQNLSYDPKKFFITLWTPNNGVHVKESAKDIQYNIKKISVKMKGGNADAYLTFKTSQEVKNLCDWWYNSKLIDPILKGMKQSSISTDNIKFFIPNIDWSHTDVTYTDEYVLNQMRLKWDENKKELSTL